MTEPGPRLAYVAGQSDKYDDMHHPPRDRLDVIGDADDLGLAILVAETADNQYEPVAVVSTTREAIEVSKTDLATRVAAVARGEDPLCPERYALWARRHSGQYERAMTINAHQHTPQRERTTVQPGPPPSGANEWSLILTTEGFLNLAQACELRLRYIDPTQSDTVWGVDVMLANGESRLIGHKDPGFAQLMELLEEQGYTISTPPGDA